MDEVKPETVDAVTTALRPWLQEALDLVKNRPDLMAEVRECMNGDGDVRIVYYSRAKAITLEAVNYNAGTCAELVRNYLVDPKGSASVM